MTRSEGAAAFGPFERLLVRRYLRGRREGFISVIAAFSLLGIALGVATLIVVMAVMNGFRIQLVDRILGFEPHVVVWPAGEGFEDAAGVEARLEAVTGVDRAAPVIQRQALATYSGNSAGAVVRSIAAEDLRALPAVARPERARGSLEAFERGEGLALGEGLARLLGAGAGDPVTLLWPQGERTPFGLAPRVRQFPVAYIFKIGVSNFDRSLAFLPQVEAERFFSTDSPDFIEVMVDAPEEVRTLRRPLRDAIDEPVALSDWQSTNSAYLQALAVERNVMFLILTLIVLVAALNIVSGMTMLVKEKAGGIAILRTMGASTGSVMRIFFVCGASIGVTGTVAGVVLGVVFCLNIESLQDIVSSLTGADVFSADVYFLSKLPAELRLRDVAATTAMALTLSLLATLYPSWRAAKVDPVRTLRDA